MKKIIVTTSWDDGNKLDLKTAELLEKYNLKGTFYVSPESKWFSLSEREIKQLSQLQEIGAHTFSHPRLTQISLEEAQKEILGSKHHLEGILGKEIKMFCYPYGKFNEEIKNLVEVSRFLGARTAEDFCIKLPKNFFEFGTTLHIYPFPLRKRDSSHYFFFRPIFDPLQRNFRPILKLRLPLGSLLSWSKLAKNLFDYTLKNGEIYHLWGHSWEVEKYGMWKELEEIFDYIANRENCIYLNNSEVLERHGKDN